MSLARRLQEQRQLGLDTLNFSIIKQVIEKELMTHARQGHKHYYLDLYNLPMISNHKGFLDKISDEVTKWLTAEQVPFRRQGNHTFIIDLVGENNA